MGGNRTRAQNHTVRHPSHRRDENQSCRSSGDRGSGPSGSGGYAAPQRMYFLEGGLLVVANLLKTDAWVQDEMRTHCNVCVQQFLPFRRRHHCRTCGEVVCSGCSSQRKIRLTDVNVECTTRVCTFCMIRATDASIKANECAMRETVAMDQRRVSMAVPRSTTTTRRNKQMSMLSVESELTDGSVVQLWPQLIPDNESARLEIVRDSIIARAEMDPTMTLLVGIVAKTLECPVAFIGILDRETLWFKASVGWDKTHIPRDDCVCSQTLMREQTMVVPDTNVDKHFHANNLAIGASPLRFYAGAPIRVLGQCIGAVCAIDSTPHDCITSAMKSTLEAVANIVSEVLEQRLERGPDQDNQHALESSMVPTERTTLDPSALGSMADITESYTYRSSDSSCSTDTPPMLDANISSVFDTPPILVARGHGTSSFVHADHHQHDVVKYTSSFSSGSSSHDLQWDAASNRSFYLSLPSVPQEYSDKIAVAMDCFQRLQTTGWAECYDAQKEYSSVRAFELRLNNGLRYTKSNVKVSGSCAEVVAQLQNYEDARLYQPLLAEVSRRYTLSTQTWMDEMMFQPDVRNADREEVRALSHWRQYPDGSHVVVAINSSRLYEAEESDLLFGWFVAPCSLDDGLGGVNVSCIVAQPHAEMTNLSADLMVRLRKCAATDDLTFSSSEPRVSAIEQRLDSFMTMCQEQEIKASYLGISSSISETESFKSFSSDSTSSLGGGGKITFVRPQLPTRSALNDNERMMLDLLDKTISTQEILAQQQHAMANVMGYHGTQIQRISTAIDRVETILADNSHKIRRSTPLQRSVRYSVS